MATEPNIRLPDPLLAQAQEAAAAEGKTVDEFTAEAVQTRLERDRLRKYIGKNKRDMSALGVEPSDVEREIDDFRRGR